MRYHRYCLLSSSFALLLFVFISFNAQAHHSPARFSEHEIVHIRGTVTRVDWRNPHVYISVADNDAGEWLLEANATTNLIRAGWSKDSFAVGDRVFFEAHANVVPDKKHVGLVAITGVDGNTKFSRIGRYETEVNGLQPSTTTLEGIWSGDARLAFSFLFSTFDHPLTAKAEAARSSYDESMDPAADCVVWPTPRLVAWNAFYPIKVEMTEKQILFTSEYGDTKRIIYMDGRSHPSSGERSNQGHSIGYWEGESLVVDTRLFADHRSPIADGVPSGAQKQVIERYTLSEDGTTASVEITQRDPEYLAEPLTGKLSWRYAPDMPFTPFECEPEVARRFAE